MVTLHSVPFSEPPVQDGQLQALRLRIQALEKDNEELTERVAKGERELDTYAMRVATFAGHLVEGLDRASASSEEGATTATRAISTIIDAARAQADRLAAVDGRMAQDSSIEDAVQRQSASFVSFEEMARKLIRAQERQGGTLEGGVQMLTEAGERAAAAANDTRVLAINAKVETARLGAESGAYNAIAVGITDLSREVRQVNTVINELCLQFGDALPKMLGAGKELMALFDSFAVTQKSRLESIEAARDGSLSLVRDAAILTREATDTILPVAHEAFTALQFQDPLSQFMRRLSRLAGQLALGPRVEFKVDDDDNGLFLDETVDRGPEVTLF